MLGVDTIFCPMFVCFISSRDLFLFVFNQSDFKVLRVILVQGNLPESFVSLSPESIESI